MDQTEQQRARLLQLLQERSFRQGDVVLASGQQSTVYIDGKMIEMHPEGAHLVGDVVVNHLRDVEFDAIGGLAVGAVPMVTSVAISCFHHGRDIEGFFVRDKVKEHGTQKVVEGRLPENAKVVVVDDVITTGKSVLKAIEAAEAQGATIVKVLAIVDRQAGAAEFFQDRGYEYDSIYTKDEVAAKAASS